MKFGLFYNPMVPKNPGSDEWEPGQEQKKFNEMLEQIEFADSLGIDYVFLGEHHFTAEYAHNSSPEVILGALSRTTKQIRMGTGIVHASHNDPVRTAERIATIDNLSNGRVEFGFGPGTTAETAPFLGDLHDRRGERSAAFGKISADILGSRGFYEGVDNEFYQLPPVNVVPKSVQLPHPPLWQSVTVAMPDALAAAASRGLGALMLAVGDPNGIGALVEAYWASLASDNVTPVGKGINPAVFAFGSGILAQTDEEAVARAKDGLDMFAFGLTGGFAYVMAHPGETLTSVFAEFRAGTRDVRVEMGTPDFMLHVGNMFSVMPGNFLNGVESARAQIRNLEAANVDGFLLNQQFGNTKHEHIMESLEIFGKEIIPEFREREAAHDEWRAARLKNINFPLATSL